MSSSDTQFKKTHGMTGTPEYRVWKSMNARCYATGQSSYQYYGGRGIRVCDRWRYDFQAFFEDMGTRPTSDHSIDRIDYNGHYELGNCRWATPQQQASNKRSNTLIVVRGVSATVSAWSRWTGIKRLTLRNRIRSGWDPEVAVSAKMQKNGVERPAVDERRLEAALERARQ